MADTTGQSPRISGSTAREIAASAEAAIREGRLEAGDALPTVRALASTLGTSPATINSAYRILRERGLVIAEGRRGTRVARRPALRTAQGARPAISVGASSAARRLGPSERARDLTSGMPDQALLPPIAPVLARLELDAAVQIAGLESPDPELLLLARRLFAADGIPEDAVAVMSGAFDCVERVLQAHLRPGDRVIVEDPGYVSVRDLLLALGLVAMPVPVDDRGLLPEPFETVLARGAEAIVVVPRAQNPLGAAMDAERAATLRGLLEPHPHLLLIEDDHAGVVSGAPFATLLTPTRERWAVIRPASKVLHPDLRVALMAGDELTVARVEGRQALGPRWVSHILQALVRELLRDPQFDAIARHAAQVYAARREALIAALAEHGIHAHGRSGLNVWVHVQEEAPIVRALLEHGWLVLAGERFRFNAVPGIRITTASLAEHEAPELARIIAAVELTGRRRTAY